jgi:tetratricopeptide (TPR) repeat protein
MTSPAGQHHKFPSSFIGREPELAEVDAAIEGCLSGRGGLFFISGEPGIGKTRLAEEISDLGRQRGMLTLWGACSEDVGAPAYWPWVPILRALQVDEPSEGDDAIARLLETVALGGTATTIPAAGFAGEERRFLLFDAVARVMHARAVHSPLLIVLDDLHAADLASLHLLAAVVPSVRDGRILLVGTFRQVELERRPDAARVVAVAGRHGKGLHLGGLSSVETHHLIQLIQDAPISAAVATDIYRRTEGNPLFVDEIARWMRLGDGSRATLEIPPAVRVVIRERLAPLSFDCRRLLGAAAVLGRDIDLALLCTMTGRSSADVTVLLREARMGGLIAAIPAGISRQRFAHMLTRDVLYDDIDPLERARMHARAGEAIESLQAGVLDAHLAELAYHFGQGAIAGTAAKAVEYAVRAGEHALAQLAYEDAAQSFEQALEVLALSPGEPFRRCEIELALASARSASGEPRARASFQRAAALARSLVSTDRARAARLLASAAIGMAERGLGLPQPLPDPEVRELLAEGLRVLGSSDDALASRLLSLLSMERSLDVGDEQCVVLGTRAIEMAQRLGDAVVLSAALSAQHFVLWRRHRVEECLETASRIVELAGRTGDLRLAVHGRGWRMVDWMTLGETARFDEDLEHLARAVEPLRQARYQWIVANYRAMQALWAGRWAEAEDLAMQSLALGERADDANTTTPPLIQLFLVRRERCMLAGEELKARFFIERFPESPSPRTLLAVTLTDLGRLDEARSEFDRLAAADFEDLRRQHRIGVLPWLAEVCVALGDRHRADLLYAQIEPYGRYSMPVGPASFVGSGFHYLGILAGALGDVQRGLEHLDTAIRENTRMRGEAWAAWSRFAAARLRLRGAASLGMRSLDEAETLLRQAGDTAMRLSMVRLQREIDSLLRQLSAAREPAAAVPGGNVIQLRGARRGATVTTAPKHGDTATGAINVNVFRLEGQYWTIGRPTRLLRLKNAKGYDYIRSLLRHPNATVHVLDLAMSPSAEEGSVAREERLGIRSWKEPGDPTLDPRARAQYRERLRDLRAELAEAEGNNDSGRVERLRGEIDFLVRELVQVAGPGRRGRPAAQAERARLNVTRAIKAAIRRIAEGDPELGRYLDTTIRTGMFCSYAPDPRFRMRWCLT